YQELEARYSSVPENNPQVKGQLEAPIIEENKENSFPNKIKKSLKNIYLQFGLLFDGLLN
ncbi:MAG: hypothetical protein V3574_01395, partial [Candidatus Moraniibacteriota bacterium]